jgi:ribosomal protein L16 Arg81 hydroxylase
MGSRSARALTPEAAQMSAPRKSTRGAGATARPKRSAARSKRATTRRALTKLSLRTLFAPLSSRDFVSEYWPKRPLWSHGAVERLGALQDLDEFSDFRRWPRERKLSMSATLPGERYQKIRVEPEQAAALFTAGATLVFNGVNLWHPLLRAWASALARELSLPSELCHANVYLSPAGKGEPKHFDAHCVVAVQLIGEKTWRLAPNRDVVHPLENYVASPAAPLERGNRRTSASSRAMSRTSTRVLMRPGSAIFLPAGYWHTTHAHEASLSVTFGLRAPRLFELVRDAIGARLAKSEAWREPAWGIGGTGPVRATSRRQLAALLADLPGELARMEPEDVLYASVPSFSQRRRAQPRSPRRRRR